MRYPKFSCGIYSNTQCPFPLQGRCALEKEAAQQLQAGLSAPFPGCCRRLDSNSLFCDCDLLWLAELLRRSAEQGSIQSAATCEAPRALHGRSIATLSAQEFNCGEPKPSMGHPAAGLCSGKCFLQLSSSLFPLLAS